MNRLRQVLRHRGGQATIVELDRWQLTGVLLLVLALTVGAFAVGRATSPGSTSANLESNVPLARALARPATTHERQIAMAEVWPPTSTIDQGLARPLEAPLPSDPTQRARALAHQQLQGARAAGLRNDTMASAPPAAPAVFTETTPGAGGYTLQVSVFDSEAAARVISDELATKGNASKIRQVRSSDGRQLFRVEVGEFASADAATVFQRRFEMSSGYSAVLVPL
jgi:cell division septation protein DedD